MPDFGDMADKAKDFAGDHDKQSDEAFDKASEFARKMCAGIAAAHA